jgi:hypothetical protein
MLFSCTVLSNRVTQLMVFFGVFLRREVDGYQRFGGNYCLVLQGDILVYVDFEVVEEKGTLTFQNN